MESADMSADSFASNNDWVGGWSGNDNKASHSSAGT